MKISLATGGDVPNIIELIEFCIKDLESHGIYQWNDFYPTLNHINENIDDKSLHTLKESEICLGIISITEKQPPEYKNVDWLHKKGKIMVITKLAVHPARQKQGIGKKLMDFAENMALNKGYASIRLDAYSGNPRALNFYEKRGYRKVGQQYFPMRELPFYLYEKLLSP